MTTYIVHAGQPAWRTIKTPAVLQAPHLADGVWETFTTEVAVTYTDADDYPCADAEYWIFRLPAAARPYTYLAVFHRYVVIQPDALVQMMLDQLRQRVVDDL